MVKSNDRPHLELGRRIAEMRKARGWSQDDLAEKSGVAISALKDIERGVAEGHIDTRRAFAESFGCSLAELYGHVTQQDVPNWQELARVLQYFSNASHERRLLALYILSNREEYLTEYEALPDAPPISKVLKKTL